MKRRFLLVLRLSSLTLLCALVQLVNTAETTTNAQDVDVLNSLRKNFNLSGWTGDPCDPGVVSWIRCTSTNPARVVHLQINESSLTGSLAASSISKMTRLERLYAHGNHFTGSIRDLDSLSFLQLVNLDNNVLSGELPDPGTWNSRTISYLSLSNNQLTGSIPDYSSFTNLSFLSLEKNSLTGTIPDLSNLTQLLYLFLGDNQLSGPVPNLPSNLCELWLENNRLSGPLDSLLPANFQLLKVDLSSNLFAGPLQELGTYSAQEMYLNNNSFSGPIPQNFGQFQRLQSLDLSANLLSGKIPSIIGDLSNLARLDLSANLLSGKIPSIIGDLSNLKRLWLENNSFQGSIPCTFAALTSLTSLRLQNNKISGAIPEFLEDLPSLQEVFLDDNNFSSIPSTLIQKRGLKITFSNNPLITMGAPGPAENSKIKSSHRKSHSWAKVATIAVMATVVCIVFLVALLTIVFRRWKLALYLDSRFTKDGLPKSATSFSLKQVRAITNNYNRMIGRGGYGPVYYGKLPAGQEVAVKVKAANSNQGQLEFFNEVMLLSNLHHKNIVPLVGYCMESDQKILLYPFMSLGTLHEHLYGSGKIGIGTSKRCVLDWKTRVEIAFNAAKGIEYLHNSCTPPIIHRDIKSSNILLTEKMQAKVGDLGISRATPENNLSGVSTAIKGTFGYLDPEYFMQLKLTTKSDVYSFGMVLLELITGKQPQSVDIPDRNMSNVRDWVEASIVTKNIDAVVDPALKGAYNSHGLLVVAELAAECTRMKGAKRPEMGYVVRKLLGILEQKVDCSQMTQDMNRDQVAFSEAPQLLMAPVGSDLRTNSVHGFLPSYSIEVIERI